MCGLPVPGGQRQVFRRAAGGAPDLGYIQHAADGVIGPHERRQIHYALFAEHGPRLQKRGIGNDVVAE